MLTFFTYSQIYRDFLLVASVNERLMLYHVKLRSIFYTQTFLVY